MKLHIKNEKGVDISKGMIGLFFEDINYGLDGGLYAEMIENRSFEFLDSRGTNDNYYQIFAGDYGWKPYPCGGAGAVLSIKMETPLNDVNPHYLEFTASESQPGFSNKAYDGIFMKKDMKYKVSFYARAAQYEGDIRIFVIKDDKIAATSVMQEKINSEWKKYQLELVASEDISEGTFVIELTKQGVVCFDFISMMPEDAVLGLFRKDLAELLKEIKPGFLRFPGGCIIEGNNLENRYQWKKSVGKPEERKANWNRWAVHGNNESNNFTSKYRYYNQTLGIGYYEYFLLCEYIGAKPLPVVNVGLACQYQSTELVPSDSEEFKEYIQDALDLIEFANGSVEKGWGKLRAEMGHPEPFNLEIIGIGNEQWETEKVDFFHRYTLFEEAIHKVYPEMKLIGSAGPNVNSQYYTDAWEFYNKKGKEKADFAYAVDEHYYVKPQWLCENTHFYDEYSRDVKVFAGEYASHCHNDDKGLKNDNYWLAGLSEAAFITGIERNADVVVLASYAPLFARIGYSQWSPNMIWFNGEKSYGTPSYYVQKLYSTQMGDYTLKATADTEEAYYTVSYDNKDKAVIIKLVNSSEKEITVNLNMDFEVSSNGKTFVMKGQLEDLNSVEEPYKVAPIEGEISISKEMNYKLEPYSFHVIRVYKK
jgi:alpha-N-arabinofuranosidase